MRRGQDSCPVRDTGLPGCAGRSAGHAGCAVCIYRSSCCGNREGRARSGLVGLHSVVFSPARVGLYWLWSWLSAEVVLKQTGALSRAQWMVESVEGMGSAAEVL